MEKSNARLGSVISAIRVLAEGPMKLTLPTVIGDAVFTSSYGGRSTLFSITRGTAGWKVDAGLIAHLTEIKNESRR